MARLTDFHRQQKVKIDNIKAKNQDKEERRPWSRPTLARRPVSGQLASSPSSSPLEGPPLQVSASHDKSGPDWHVGCKTPDFHRKPESLYRRDSLWISGYHVQNVSQINTQSHTSHHIRVKVYNLLHVHYGVHHYKPLG
jgi:hypothetical protein